MWKNVIGQERVKRILAQALDSKMLPNAYLFTGPEGVGKDAAAIELAKALNCQDAAFGGIEACDICTNCRTIGNFSSPLLQYIFAKAKAKTKAEESESEDKEFDVVSIAREELAIKSSDPYHDISIPKAINISLPQIRELISALSRSVPRGAKRIVIISEADSMVQQAQNALLKTLEEPNENTLLILTSSKPSRLYPTILSRCQDLRFDLLTVEELSKALVEKENKDKSQANFLARLSGGSYSVAKTFDSEDVSILREQIVRFMRTSLSHSRQSIVPLLKEIIPSGKGKFLEGRQTVERILDFLELWFRDALAIALGSEEAVFNADQLEDLKRFTANFGNAQALLNAISCVASARRKVGLQLQIRPVMLELAIDLETALPRI